MTIHSLALTPLISLIAGVLILIMPRLLNYIVALYLIVVGCSGFFLTLLAETLGRASRKSHPRGHRPPVSIFP